MRALNVLFRASYLAFPSHIASGTTSPTLKCISYSPWHLDKHLSVTTRITGHSCIHIAATHYQANIHAELPTPTPALKRRKPNHFITSSHESEHKFMEYMGKELGFDWPDGWYQVDSNHFSMFNGHSLLKKYGYSPSEVVMGVFKDHLWLPWKFTKVSEGFWDDKTNQKIFLKHLEVKLGYTKMEDWYGIQAKDFVEHGGYTLLQRYMSPRLVVMGVITDHPWQVWQFKHVGPSFWADLNNQKLFLKHVGDKLGYVTMEDWYGIKGDQLILYGGAGLLRKYKGSPSAMVTAAFHTHKWEMWRFKTIPRAHLLQPNMIKTYFETLMPKLGIKHLSEWRNISFRQLQALGPCWHIKQLGLFSALKSAYPTHNWTSGSFENTLCSSQHFVASLLRRHMPGVEVLENYYHKATQFDHSGNAMSIDVFIPSLLLGLEYNGAQHYHDLNSVVLSSASNPKKHDTLKLAQFLSAKYTFIHIPWWWDGKFSSLQEIIRAHRPDILLETA